MASPDESRVDEARDETDAPVASDPDPAPSDLQEPAAQTADAVPAAPDMNGGSVPPGSAGAVSPGRPRGAASFPGGAPPVVTPISEVPILPIQPTVPDNPSIQVTTVEPTAASFPGGPPPPAPPPRPDPAPPVEASAPARPDPAPPAEAAGALAEAFTPDPADRASPTATAAETEAGHAAPADQAPPAVPAAEARAAMEPAASAAVAPAPPGEQAHGMADEGTGGGRPSGRRRRRGRGGRVLAPAQARPAGGAGTATPPETAAEPPEATASLDGEDLQATEHQPDAAQPAQGPAAAGAAGSPRTRARRRRRAAARARTRETTEPAAAGEPAEAETPATSPAAAGRAARAPASAGEPTAAGSAEAAPAGRTASRRRGGRAGRTGEPRVAGDGAAAEAQTSRAGEAQTGAAPAEGGTGRARRRGRGRSAAEPRDEAATGTATEAPAGQRGSERSTRLETRTRDRGARQADRGRRRPSGLTEEQKRVMREEGPEKRMLVTEGAERTQIGVLEGPTLVEHYVTRKSGRSLVGNVYLGRVQNVLPGMEAAFIDIGRGRNAVLYAGEVNYDEEDLDGEAPRIEKVLKPGQSVLVQVTKDPIGAKGARLTAQVSLAGRYLVLQPEDNTFGISRRLPEAERSRLRDILREVRPKGLGLIVRTAAEGASADDLRADLARLQARWEAVERKAKKASAPAVIYSEPELVVRVIRDIFSPDFTELVVDDGELYQRVEEYLQEVAPDLLPKLRRHDNGLPLFEHYRVVEQIHKALERKVWLPSGGSIVIDRTEAMTVVDVNTGKFVGRANLEETVVANNLEAAEEIVRQLRLRDIGGIIIIDFIDMLFERNQQAVVDRLRAALARDKTKSQVMEVSSLGLVQMTRKRVSGGLLDSFSETCPTCDGRGVVITHEI